MSLPNAPREQEFMLNGQNKPTMPWGLWFDKVVEDVPTIGAALDPSEAVQTDASSNLVTISNTGTGNNVLSAFPTLTGIVTAEAITASGFVTVGTTLGVTGAATITGLLSADGGIYVGVGTISQSRIVQTAVNGLSMSGITGSSNDFLIASAANVSILYNPTGTNGITIAGTGLTLAAGSDLIGSSTSDITINTNKFTVAGATGNTLVGGTLDVTGQTTLTGFLLANGGIYVGVGTLSTSRIVQTAVNGLSMRGITGSSNDFLIASAANVSILYNPTGTNGITIAGTGLTLAANADLIGSSTSDITINTDKFTVAGATGNTVVGGNLNLSASGKGLGVKGGAATDYIGTAVLVGGTVTVNNTNIAATDRLQIWVETAGGVQGFLSSTRVASTSFTINSTNALDTSTVGYHIIRTL